jgi:hypothetical protein
MRITLVLFTYLFISLTSFGQKIRFASSIGTSFIHWHEKQATIDFGAQITFQNPGKKHLFYAKLNTLGNITASPVDRQTFTFVEPPTMPNNMPLSATEPLSALYRGGQAEVGFQWPMKSGFSPLLAIYSKSLARKITSDQSQYIEEEKYALHGISVGLNYEWKGKTSTINLQGQVFEPIYRDITLYGRYIGVPYTSMTSDNSISYKTRIDVHFKKYGICVNYEILNFGSAKNPNSKSIDSSQAQLLSTLFTYYF